MAAAEAGGPVMFLNPSVRESGEKFSAPQSMRFVTTGDFAPFSAFDATGKPRGIHVDLARELCAEMGVRGACTLQVLPFDEIGAMVASGQADAALAGITPTAANRETLAFSLPYARLPARFITAANGKAEVAVVAGSVHEAMARNMFPERTFLPVETVAKLHEALTTGAAGAAFGDGLSLGAWAASPASAGCCTLAPGAYVLPGLHDDALRVAVQNGRGELLAALNAALKTMQVSGRMNEILLRHIPFALTE